MLSKVLTSMRSMGQRGHHLYARSSETDKKFVWPPSDRFLKYREIKKTYKVFLPLQKNNQPKNKTKPQLWNTHPSSLCFLMIYVKTDNFPGVFTLQPNITTTTAYQGNFILVLKFKGFNEKRTQLCLKNYLK